jgi:hypothetical protein
MQGSLSDRGALRMSRGQFLRLPERAFEAPDSDGGHGAADAGRGERRDHEVQAQGSAADTSALRWRRGPRGGAPCPGGQALSAQGGDGRAVPKSSRRCRHRQPDVRGAVGRALASPTGRRTCVTVW